MLEAQGRRYGLLHGWLRPSQFEACREHSQRDGECSDLICPCPRPVPTDSAECAVPVRIELALQLSFAAPKATPLAVAAGIAVAAVGVASALRGALDAHDTPFV
jgi:hypothetical protein